MKKVKTVRLIVSLHRRLKILAVKTGKELEYHLGKAVSQYLKRKER